ncbi:MAG TPA: hypothetical protein VGE98_04750 [Thermoanaerobaculia bacterium]
MSSERNDAAPPRWAEAMLVRVLAPADSPAIAGDLLEHYREGVLPTRGRLRADLWYVGQVASLVGRIAIGVKEGRLRDRSLGVALGLVIALVIVLSNVVLPKAGVTFPDADLDGPLFIGSLFAAFAVCGFLAYRRRQGYSAPFRAGLVVAFCSLSIAMLTFFAVDNLFFDLVSRQPEKIWSFRHSHDSSMRAHINLGLAKGVVLFLPVLTGLGGVCGSLGGLVGSLVTFLRSLLSGEPRP